MGQEKLFKDNCNPQGTVVLNWFGESEEELVHYARAYHSAARTIIEDLKNKNFGLDACPIDEFLAYPVIFLYRHSLELYMKTIIFVWASNLETEQVGDIDIEKLFQNHSLDSLRQKVEKIFEVNGWGWNLNSKYFKNISDFRKVISEMHVLDKNSATFRYPIRSDGKPSLEKFLKFNLFQFCCVVNDLLNALDGAVSLACERCR